MANFKPTICGRKNLYIPEGECSDCEYLEERVRRLEECCAEVQEQIANKIDIDNILAGENVTIDRFGDTIVIRTDCECGGCTATKAELMNCLGVRELELALFDTDDEDETWYVLGRLTDETIGDGTCRCTKQEIMACLGVRELPMSIGDTSGQSEDWYILGRSSSESPGDGSTVPGYNCNKWEMLATLDYQEVRIRIDDTDSGQEWTLLGRPKL